MVWPQSAHPEGLSARSWRKRNQWKTVGGKCTLYGPTLGYPKHACTHIHTHRHTPVCPQQYEPRRSAASGAGLGLHACPPLTADVF